VSTGFEFAVRDEGKDYAAASPDFKFAASVAEFGLLLRDSKFKGTATYDAVLELAEAIRGADPKGERQEFLDLVRRARDFSKR
jgi:Ca-activated chloride channel family protein